MTRPIFPPRYLMGALAVMGALYLLLPGPTLVPFPFSLIGTAFLAAGGVVNLLADALFKRAGTTVKPFEDPSDLITGGVFSLSRNPMYLGFELILIGAALLLGVLTPFTVPLMFPGVITSRFIRAEEESLHRIFGEQWIEYRDRVRRWI